MSRLHCLRVIQTVEYLDIPPCRPNGVEVEIGRRDPYPTPSVTVFDDVSRTDETHSRTKDAPLNRSIVEFTKVIEPLAADFHVVCPTLPGYGFSGKPAATG